MISPRDGAAGNTYAVLEPTGLLAPFTPVVTTMIIFAYILIVLAILNGIALAAAIQDDGLTPSVVFFLAIACLCIFFTSTFFQEAGSFRGQACPDDTFIRVKLITVAEAFRWRVLCQSPDDTRYWVDLTE